MMQLVWLGVYVTVFFFDVGSGRKFRWPAAFYVGYWLLMLVGDVAHDAALGWRLIDAALLLANVSEFRHRPPRRRKRTTGLLGYKSRALLAKIAPQTQAA